MITSDFHMHSAFSLDSESAPEEMIRASIDKELKTICFTDHYDKDYFYPEGEAVIDGAEYFAVMAELREQYQSEIDIRIGIELGLQPHLGSYYKEFINASPFDFVIGSTHVVRKHDLYERVLFEEYTDGEAYGIVLDEILKNIKAISDFDVLGHLDYMTRYGNHQARDYSYEIYRDKIDEIFKYLISRGKGVELNMSGFKYGLGFCHPHPDALKRYKELGGEIITVGADGHCPEHIAYDFHRVEGILSRAGFKYYTEFKGRKPIFKQVS